MRNQTVAPISSPSANSWRRPEAPRTVYSDNDLINAYMKGCADGMKTRDKILLETLKSNLDNAQKIVAEFYEQLNKNFHCSSLRLRVKDVAEFDSLFIVDEDDFVKDAFKEAYKKARSTKKEVNRPTFNLSFSFMPLSNALNEDELLIDGYYFEYGKQSKS